MLWEGPQVPVLGTLDVTVEELFGAALNALRLIAVGLAFTAYALLHRPRPAACLGLGRAPLGARRRARDASRAHAPTRRARVARGAEGTGRRGRRSARTRSAALAARRGLARARGQPRRGDGVTRVRPARRHARAAAAPGARAIGPRSSRPSARRHGGAVALASARRVSFTYPRRGGRRCDDVSLRLEPGERVARARAVRLGEVDAYPRARGPRAALPRRSLLRAGSRSPAATRARHARPSWPGTVATVFQDPEDQVVMTLARNEVAFALENVATPPAEIWPRVAEALASVGAAPSRRAADARAFGRRAAASLPRVRALAATAAPAARRADVAARPGRRRVVPRGCTPSSPRRSSLSEQRVARALSFATRVLYLERGRMLLDAPRAGGDRVARGHRPAAVRRGHDRCRQRQRSVRRRRHDRRRMVLVRRSLGARGRLARGPPRRGRRTRRAERVRKIDTGQARGRAARASTRPRAQAAVARGTSRRTPGATSRASARSTRSRSASAATGTRALDALDAVGLALGRRAPPARPLERRAGAARDRGGCRGRARPARPRRADARRRPRAQGGARRVAHRATRERGRGVLIATHDRSFPADRRVALAAPAREEALVAA